MSVHVEVVRVFTTADGAGGNELGIIESSAATAGHEQELAARLGFSETVFIDAMDEPTVRLRIFTPASELPFAGHPTVGTAWHLISRGHQVLTLDVPAGLVSVDQDGDDVSVTARPEWAPAFDFHELSSAGEVEALDANAVPGGHDYYWAWVEESAGTVRSRMFGRAMGIREDEATGSAAIALTGMLRRDLVITQGAGSRLTTRWIDPLATVGGRSIHDRVIELD